MGAAICCGIVSAQQHDEVLSPEELAARREAAANAAEERSKKFSQGIQYLLVYELINSLTRLINSRRRRGRKAESESETS